MARNGDDRIILHFVSLPAPRPLSSLTQPAQDYDCFYAQVVENQQPALKALPLGRVV